MTTESNRKVAVFTGHRDILPGDDQLIRDSVTDLCSRFDELVFGGAIGADTLALEAAINYANNNPKWPDITIVVPNRVADQPHEAKMMIGRAVIEADAKIVEMLEGYTPASLKARNRRMIDRIEVGHGLVLAYWRGIYKSGTYSAIRYAMNKGIPVLQIKPEFAGQTPPTP